jgi:hypothetical protein
MKRRLAWLQFRFSTPRWPIVGIAAIIFLCGVWWHHAGLLLGGALILCFAIRRVSSESSDADAFTSKRPRRRYSDRREDARSGATDVDDTPGQSDSAHSDRESRILNPSQHGRLPKSTDALVEELLDTSRYALLLRPETKAHLSQVHIVRAIRKLDEEMALVPAGRVLLGQLAEQSNSACGPLDVDPKLAERHLVDVEPAYLDRFCVTNSSSSGMKKPCQPFWILSIKRAHPVRATGTTVSLLLVISGCPWSASVGMKPGRTPAGWASACQPMPSGQKPALGRSSPHQAASRSAATRGANRSTSAALTFTAAEAPARCQSTSTRAARAWVASIN